MKIVSWNCFYGECRKRADLLAKTAPKFSPDIAILQECSEPDKDQGDDCIWFGKNPKGVGIRAYGDWKVTKGQMNDEVPDSVYHVKVSGPETFNLLAVWAQKRPASTYVRAVKEGVKAYSSFLNPDPLMIVGDFNSHATLDPNHSELVRCLWKEFGLVSAYHLGAMRDGGNTETPTFYFYWQENRPFHIDYCFIPLKWANRLGDVQIGNYGDWQKESDHRPLLVEIKPGDG